MLREFIATNRETILERARSRVVGRSGPGVAENRTEGLPVFLDQLGEALRKATSREKIDHRDIQNSAERHGKNLFHDGLSVDQVVHDYGDLCQVITGLANEQSAPVAVEEFQTLNLCLDDAIAGAVSSYAQERQGANTNDGAERLGSLAHEMRNVLNAALLSFGSIQRGVVSAGGSTGAVHARSLMRMGTLIDRSIADVRLDGGLGRMERISLWEIVEEVAVGASLVAQSRGLHFVVTQVDHTVVVLADRQILAAALANLLQNALKFTAPGTTVKLTASTTTSRVIIDVEDQCGGLPADEHEKLLQPFTQQGHDRTGMGLGLSICVKAVKAIGGELRIRDLPGIGCVFTIDLPKQSPPPLHAVPDEKAEAGGRGRPAKATRAV